MTRDDIVKCDCCNQPGRRRREHVCPDGWFFIESKVASSRRGIVHVVYACSQACRDGLWQKGPGPANIDEAGSARMHERNRRDG